MLDWSCYRNRFPVRIVAVSVILLAALVASAGADTVDFTSRRPLGTLGVQAREVTVGDLAADAARRAGRAQIGFVAASELREVDSEIPAGRVSSQGIVDLLSYPDDSIVVIRLTGADVRAALERSVSSQPNRSLGFLQVSGIRFNFDPGARSGQRVRQVTVAGEALVPERQYEVAMARSLAHGALGYWRIWGKDDIVRETNTPFSQAVETFLAETKTVDYSGTDRVIQET